MPYDDQLAHLLAARSQLQQQQQPFSAAALATPVRVPSPPAADLFYERLKIDQQLRPHQQQQALTLASARRQVLLNQWQKQQLPTAAAATYIGQQQQLGQLLKQHQERMLMAEYLQSRGHSPSASGTASPTLEPMLSLGDMQRRRMLLQSMLGRAEQVAVAAVAAATPVSAAPKGMVGTTMANPSEAPSTVTKEEKEQAVVEEDDEEQFFEKHKLPSQKERFPVKLYRMIYEAEKEGNTSIISFLPHGRAFAIHNEAEFVREILPRYFPGCRLSSFQKQLNLYGFHKITVGKDKGKLNYFHKHFLKGAPSQTERIERKRGSGEKQR